MKPGQLIADRYRVRNVLGRGGMGEVYLAHDQRLATDVALKRVPLELAQEPSVREALVREARILAKLSHTHIVRLFDLAETPDGLFLVLEYVCGPSLDKLLLQRPVLSLDELQHVFEHVVQALTLAHSVGVYHRDLKPSNLLVALSGEEQRLFIREQILPPTLGNTLIKVTDFGLAKMVQQRTRAQEASGTISGTPAYMAPEQFRGELPSPETDIYALGLIAYECLSGSLPIGSAQPIYFHLFVTPPPIPGVLAHLNAAIQKAIAKDRADRFPSAAAFLEALCGPPAHIRRSQEEALPPPFPSGARPSPIRPDLGGTRFSTRALWAGVGAVAGLAVAIPAVVRLWPRPTTPAKQPTLSSRTVKTAVELPAPPPARFAPSIDSFPPIIERARRLVSPDPLPRGVDRPAVLARLRVLGRDLSGFGPDDTLYLTDSGHYIAAVREGKLVWQYRLPGDGAQLTILPEGLLFINCSHGDRWFCFNAAGQGGELPSRLIQTPTVRTAYLQINAAATPASCVDPDAKHPNPRLEAWRPGRREPLWRLPLDARCAGSTVTTGNGKFFIQTESHTVYLVSNEGQVIWTYAAPCSLQDRVLLADNTAVGSCREEKSVLGIHGGQLAFQRGDVPTPEAQDRDGNFYGLNVSAGYDKQVLEKINSRGQVLWRFPLSTSSTPKVALSPTGKLYVLDEFAGHQLVMIGDPVL